MTSKRRLILLVFATVIATLLTMPGLVTRGAGKRTFRSPPVAGQAQAGTNDSFGPCERRPGDEVAIANDLLKNRYTLSHFKTVSLPANLKWNENPVHDPNWEFNLHTLRYVDALWDAYRETGDRRYRDRYAFLLRDWFVDNPRSHSPSKYSWNDHSTAWRGVMYACALTRLPHEAWLLRAAADHGRLLADDHFYVHHGNHALNQAVGLLSLGCVMNDGSWQRLAAGRIEQLGRESIDAQGVINEQAVGYQWYNYTRYRDALAHLRWCGVTPSRSLTQRVASMLAFLAFGALPNGRWDLLGDTLDLAPQSIPGTPLEYVVSGGDFGLPPSSMWATYAAGFSFVRSGWGTKRPLADETALSLRFGPARRFHGHNDPASMTLYGLGDRILVDPSMYHFVRDRWRTWFASAEAHNTVTSDGAPTRADGPTTLVAERHESGYDFIALEHRKIPGVVATRRVFYSRRLDVVVVEDDLTSDAPRAFHQWWHLHPQANPQITPAGVFTGREGSRANAWLVQLAGGSERIVKGQSDPIQGWTSFDYGRLLRAPVLDVGASGTHVRFVTLIVPSSSSQQQWRVLDFSQHAVGFDLTLAKAGVIETIGVRGANAWLRTS